MNEKATSHKDLEAAVDELAPRLLSYCRGRVGDAALAEDAAQEALTALVQRWRRQGPPESCEAFAFTIARRRLGRALRYRGWLRPLEALNQRRSCRPDPEEETLQRTRLQSTLDALGELPRRNREALLLVVAGELSVGTAAGILGISTSALKMRLHRARHQLAGLLEPAAPSPGTGKAGDEHGTSTFPIRS